MNLLTWNKYFLYETVLSNSIQQLSDHTLLFALQNDLYCVGWSVKLYSVTHLWSQMADRKCTHAHWRQCV